MPGRTLLFVVDPLAGLQPGHDTSVAMMESAQQRGHRVLVTTMGELAVVEGRAVASATEVHLQPVTLRDGRWVAEPEWYVAEAPHRVVLDDVDAVFVRTDPPVDATYLRGTYLLDLTSALVVNAPAGLRDANEHLFALRFPDLGPETIVSGVIADLVEATRSWGGGVLKPTEGMAGRGIMLLRPDDPNLHSILEVATTRGRDQDVVQRYLPAAERDGDRRVIVVDGTPVGVVRRVAGAHDFRCNMAAGASVVADTVTPRDKDICDRMSGTLAAEGLLFVGIDVIGGCLTEINVTSPTGVREIDAFAGVRLGDCIIGAVERRLAPLGTPGER